MPRLRGRTRSAQHDQPQPLITIANQGQAPKYFNKVEMGNEFILQVNPEIEDEDIFDQLMTPNLKPWHKEIINNWPHYCVGEINYSFSYEMIGYQMVFDAEATLHQANMIIEEIVSNLRNNKFQVKVISIDGSQPVKFQYTAPLF